MANIFALAGITASDYQFVNTVGQQLTYELTKQYLERVNLDMQLSLSMFVQGTTTKFQERYQLPGGGRMQEIGRLARPAVVRATGSFTVGYPLQGFGDAVAADRVDMAYMSTAEYERHVDSVVIRDRNEVRFRILRALFKSTDTSIEDPERGAITVKPLANGDSVLYPPVLGSSSEATDNHYLESGYAAAAISDSNNPLVTLRNEIEEHFGTQTGGNNIVVFCNNAQSEQLGALTDFVSIVDYRVRAGANVDTPMGVPPNIPTTARVLGVSNGCWVVEWRFIPANYLVAVDADQPAPLKMRVDPPETGLPLGLQLVARETLNPMETAIWEHRYGFGVANRLNGAVMELGTGGTYTIPTSPEDYS